MDPQNTTAASVESAVIVSVVENNEGPTEYEINSNSDSETKGLVSPDLIQIKAQSEEEIFRRITAFTTNKRAEINERDIRDFISPFSTDPESGCARTEAVYVHGEGEKSHILLKRVKNTYGPQTRIVEGEEEEYSERSRARLPISVTRAEAVEERLANIEMHLNMRGGGKDIFSRIKRLENRINFLEGLSLEYFAKGAPPVKENSSAQKESNGSDQPATTQQSTESLADIDRRIGELKQALKRKRQGEQGGNVHPS